MSLVIAWLHVWFHAFVRNWTWTGSGRGVSTYLCPDRPLNPKDTLVLNMNDYYKFPVNFFCTMMWHHVCELCDVRRLIHVCHVWLPYDLSISIIHIKSTSWFSSSFQLKSCHLIPSVKKKYFILFTFSWTVDLKHTPTL